MKKNLIWLIVLLVLHTLVMLFTQFTAWPEMLIYPYLLKQGFAFYGDIVQPYLPVLPYGLYLGFSWLGFSASSLQIISILLVLVTDVILYLVVINFFPYFSVNLILFIYIFLQIFFEGNGIWFDHAAVPFILIAFVFWNFFLKSKAHKDLIICGLMLGIALTIKQTSFWYALPITGYLLFKKYPRSCLFFWSCFFTPLFLLFIIFGPGRLWYWGIYYPLVMMSRAWGYVLYPKLKQLAMVAMVLFPLIIDAINKFNKKNYTQCWLFIWLFFSFGFLIPRFAYFHLQPALPFLAIGLVEANKLIDKNKLLKILSMAYWIFLCFIIGRYLIRQYNRPVRFFEPEVFKTTSFLKQILPVYQPVFFYNDMGNYMVTGEFLPVKPWAYNFPWYMELPGLQEKIIEALEKNKVIRVVFVPFKNEGKYVPGSYVPKLIDQYIKANYKIDKKINNDLFLLKRFDH